MKKFEICYPNYSKKSLTFTMDDGRIKYDTKLMSILKPAMIKGTFNIPRVTEATPEEYREIYRGYEIANHCKHHPAAFEDGVEYKVSGEPFDKETSDPEYIYPHPEIEGLYYIKRTRGWRLIAEPNAYIRCIEECHSELEEVFGEGSIRSFVWPFNEQSCAAVKLYLGGMSYYGVRKSGVSLDTTGFGFPEDTHRWICNANHNNLLEIMEKYDSYPDDGELKFFAFGVHASDFEVNDKWADLEEFASRYGNRPDDFWYATVGEIFDYVLASRSLTVSDGAVRNDSSLPIYILLNGERRVISPNEELSLI